LNKLEKMQSRHWLPDSTPRKMSALLLKLGDVSVRGTTTYDGMQVFSVRFHQPGVSEN
jgi:hypothetical protein